MSKYIDADRLRAKIEKERKNALDAYKASARAYDMGGADYLAEVLLIIEQLKKEQPEVDLEEEIDKVWDNGLSDEFAGPHNNFDICARLARHFYELGKLNARKEENK